MSTRSSLACVQVLRGLAAASVVLFHCGSILAQPDYGGAALFGGLTSYGRFGVNLFFLLSGFIILRAHREDLGNRAALPRYAFRRIVRIYPIYWIVLTLNLAVSATGLGNPDFSWTAANMASAYMLVPLAGDVTLPLKVAWSLFYEVQFYLLFAVALISARLALVLAGVWLAAIATAIAFNATESIQLLSPWNLYFLAGMGVAWLSERVPGRYAYALLGAAALLFALFLAVGPTGDIRLEGVNGTTYWFLAIFGALFLGAVLLEPASHAAPRWLLLSGDASYSIYLIHTSIISAVALLAARIGVVGALGGYGLFALVLAGALSVGVSLYLFVERPLLRAMNRHAPAAAPAPA